MAEEKKDEEKEDDGFKYPSIKLKSKIAPEIAIKTVEKIMKIVGFLDLSSKRVSQLCHYIERGSLMVEGNDLYYSLKKPIKLHEDKLEQRFKMSECNDGKLLEHGVDIIAHVRNVQAGGESSADNIRTIVGASLGIPEDFAGQINTTDLMTVYTFYSLFFIGL